MATSWWATPTRPRPPSARPSASPWIWTWTTPSSPRSRPCRPPRCTRCCWSRRGGTTGGSQKGIRLINGAQVNSTASGGGDITIIGTAGEVSGTGSGNYGVQIDDFGSPSEVTTVDGDISITGQGKGLTGSNQNYGVFLEDDAEVVATGTGAITVQGTGGTGNNNEHGVLVSGSGSKIQVNTGNLSVTGTGGDQSGVGRGQGVRLTGNTEGFLTTGSGNIEITGIGIGTQDGIRIQGSTTAELGGNSATGDITLISDRIRFDSGSIESSGALTIAPYTTSTTIGLGNSTTGTLNLTDTELSYIQDGFSDITFGDITAGTGAVDISNVTLSDSVTVAGGSIDVTGLNVATNDVTLTARTGTLTDGGDGATDVTGATVTLNASGDIGADGNELSLAATNLVTDTSAGNGDQFLDVSDIVTINQINAGTGDLEITINGHLNMARSLLVGRGCFTLEFELRPLGIEG